MKADCQTLAIAGYVAQLLKSRCAAADLQAIDEWVEPEFQSNMYDVGRRSAGAGRATKEPSVKNWHDYLWLR